MTKLEYIENASLAGGFWLFCAVLQKYGWLPITSRD